MKRSYIIAVTYYDSPGILRTFGPYATEEAANAAEPKLQDLYQPEGMGKWEVVPMYSIDTED